MEDNIQKYYYICSEPNTKFVYLITNIFINETGLLNRKLDRVMPSKCIFRQFNSNFAHANASRLIFFQTKRNRKYCAKS